ncbi:MAG: GNAT family N-acetyltransferase [Caldilineales bacterium]|nr:GNAT family N-acetyltransferase [Caldilineales bacterium]
MNLSFRPARDADIPALSALVDGAYAPQVRRLYGDSSRGRWLHYDENKIQTYMSRQPDGVRVGDWKDTIYTVAVCRCYGSLGWFHSLAVAKSHQRHGLGKQAVRDAESFLVKSGVATIGLMTWPDAVDNIGFYQRLGYRTAGLSVFAYRRIEKRLARGKSPLSGVLLSDLTPWLQRRALDAVTGLCDEIMSRLDYSSWLLWSLQQRVGDTLLLWQDDRLLALALAYRLSNHWLEGKLFLVSPVATDVEIIWALEHVRRWAHDLELDSFGFPLDLQQNATTELFRQQDFRLFGDSMLNMVRGPFWPPLGIHNLRFAG